MLEVSERMIVFENTTAIFSSEPRAASQRVDWSDEIYTTVPVHSKMSAFQSPAGNKQFYSSECRAFWCT